MSATHRTVTDTELEILKALWKLGEGSVRQVLAELAPMGRDWAYTTAQTMLTRLQEKGIVASEKRGRSHAVHSDAADRRLSSPAASRDWIRAHTAAP